MGGLRWVGGLAHPPCLPLHPPSQHAHTATPCTQYTRRVAFAALAGEPWGFMGSRQLLWALEEGGAAGGANPVEGLDLAGIEAVGAGCGGWGG